ncbi:23S rRNA (guanine(745)-N(1))-methyltransferase [Carnimonas bestiolae]|uniref:23S rRNA (guanine(745)-N(1))-methyltransferase n=1 Tax=Carnimonas bestiolae TaxID=3402172 RepID=UPI003F4A86DB
MPYRCPLCRLSLHPLSAGWGCQNGHRFDRAKEGYVHLLPANRKHSRAPGDEKGMVQARRRFLEAGHYQPLAAYLREQSADLAPQRLLDIGCGEGYFTAALAAGFPEAASYGVDISKNAVQKAAKKYPAVSFCVASNHDLPFEDHAFDLIVRTYAPSSDAELTRLISANGQLIIVTPGPDHLRELRERIYQQVNDHAETPSVPLGFTLLDSQRIEHQIAASGAEALDLLTMTPFGWHASDELKSALASETQVALSADFIIQRYQVSR